MNNRERSVKKRKREVNNSHTGPGTNHKSPFEPFRATERAEGSQNHRSKPPNPNYKNRKGSINQELIKLGKDEVADNSDFEAADGVIPPTVRVFSDLDIAPGIQRAIASMGFSELKEIQRDLIPLILARKDVIATSKPGSGKSLAALISSISLLESKRFKPRNGTGIIVLTSTREPAHQLLGVTSELLAGSAQTSGTATDGSNFRSESEKIEKGINIIIATPRRLLEHLKKTTAFVVEDLQTLVLDDAERLLDIKMKEVMEQIIELLPKKKQTVILTTTAIPNNITEALCLKEPISIGSEDGDEEELSAPKSRVQAYVTIAPDKRFLLLFSFVKKFQKKRKIVVVLSSTAAVKAYSDILNAMGLPVLDIHGKQTTQKRATTLSEFKGAKQRTLICTDAVIQNLEIPTVNWLIQYDPPENPTRYISRLGRTATKSVIFLQPSELSFLDYLREANVTTNEFEFLNKQLMAVQANLEKLISKNYALHCEAKDAFRSYLKSYTTHILPSIFDVSKLDLVKTAKSFGFNMPPRVEVKEPEEKEEKWKMTYGPTNPGIKGAKRMKMV